MKIVTVSGAQSGVGKTKVVESLLKRLKGWSALKVTVVKDSPCPREIACGICSEQNIPFSIISNLKVINQRGKDTQRMKSAGAKKVLWLRATSRGLESGFKQALKKLSAKKFGGKSTPGIVIEGTSILKYLNPDLAILVKRKHSIFKDSAKQVLKKVDLVLTI